MGIAENTLQQLPFVHIELEWSIVAIWLLPLQFSVELGVWPPALD